MASALAFQANALRSADRIDEARALFVRSQEIFEHCGDSSDLRASFYSLRASLEIGQAEFEQALETVDAALASASHPEERVRLFLQRSMVWIYSNETVKALEAVGCAVSLLDDSFEPRLSCCVHRHHLEVLSRVGRLDEAQEVLQRVREAAEGLDSDLDNIRLDWVEARIATGLGRVAEGEALYRQVRAAFLERGLPYKAAIATVELARHLFRQGRFPEVAALAMESAAEFRRQGVEPEVLGALALLEEATSGHLTLKAIEQLLRRVEQAAHGR
jgi:tetratricopeptide (TPR) repeat protein